MKFPHLQFGGSALELLCCTNTVVPLLVGKTGMRGKTGMQNWLVATVAGKFFAPLVVDKCEIRVDEKFQSRRLESTYDI